MSVLSLRVGLSEVLLAATALMLVVSYLAYRKRRQDVAQYCAWAMLAASFYSFGYACQIISTNLQQAKLWLNVQYIGIPFIVTFWLLLAIVYTGNRAYLKRWAAVLLFAIPVIILISQLTNDIHHLFYRELRFDPSDSNLSSVVITKGPLYWLHFGYFNVEAVVGMALYLRMYAKSIPIVRRQVVMLMVSGAAPWLLNMIYLAIFGRAEVDLTPFGFAISSFAYLWGIYRFNLLRLVPIAYQKVFETMQDGVVILDYDHNLSHVNEAARGMLRELRLWNGQTVSVHKVFASNPELLAKIAAGGADESRIAIRQGQELRQYQVRISTIYDQAGMEMGKLIIFSDVTQAVLYQEQLLANASQLEELNAFKDKLFAVVAHDIRDPLAMMVNLSEIIEEDFIEPGSEESHIFQKIGGQVRDTHLLVENLLDWVRSQRDKINFHPMVWELEPSIHQAAQTLKHHLERKRIRMSVSVQEGSEVYADKDMMELVLRNLMLNAIKYTGTGGWIQVEAADHGGHMIVSVKDSGAGVDSEVGKTLFHEVQPGSAPGTDGERGTGLGLYLCGKFVRLNGGDIGYTSVPGQGSTFYFTLPSTKTANVRQRTWKEIDAI
ncbi:histidine kinase N-terminal 7TM domain-containing protein [Cohnella lubricantis]|uniref:sensor histidine kinase n=1 Tax=Cohnella lubricantis TaxID=2163172 RepID=UPI003159D092